MAILHCSDLHFGAVPTRRVPRWLIPPFQGGAGHDYRLCLPFHNAVADVAALANLPSANDLRIVVSGDLTATGTKQEFLVAHTFLQGSWHSQRHSTGGGRLGFRREEHPGSTLVTVPGNHDQWGGSRVWMWGHNPNLVPEHFEGTPWQRIWRVGQLEVELFGLDSNVGMLPVANYSAGGRLDFTSGGEVDRLRAMLAQSDLEGHPERTVRVRAFVVHHHLTGHRLPLPLDSQSVDELLRLAEAHQVRAILTGHTHDFFFQSFRTRPTGKAQVWELRAASALQGPPGRRPRPGFLAHEITLDSQGLPRWCVWRYLWYNNNRFARVQRSHIVA